jgi:nitrogen fixation/metabolism regulation signal transduction histidine kinase
MSDLHNKSVPEPPPQHSRRRRWVPWVFGGVVVLLLSVLASQQLWLWNVIQPDTASDTLVLYALSTLNFVAFVVFSFIFIRSLLKLGRERRQRELGSKIKTRLLVYFIAISFLPITAMATFSYLFLNRSIEKWFNNATQSAIREAQQIQRESLSTEIRNLRETGSLIAVLLNRQSETSWQPTLDEMLVAGHLSAVEIVTRQGQVLYKSDAGLPDADRLSLEDLLEKARKSPNLIGDSLADGKGFDVLAVPLSVDRSLLISPAKRSETDLIDKSTGPNSEYNHLALRQKRVRWLGLSTLGLLTLILLFVSSWVAHSFGPHFTPISVGEATNEIARGQSVARRTTFTRRIGIAGSFIQPNDDPTRRESKTN